jgi:hypothetical protein
VETATDIRAEVWREIAVTISKRGVNAAHALLRQHAIAPYRGRTEAPKKNRGDATHWIDAEMRSRMSEIVRDATKDGAVYVGEEENIPLNLSHGDFLARTDELDGTTNALTLFSAFAIVVFIERVRRNEESVSHVAGAIAAATGEVTSWSREQSGRDNVVIEWPAPFSWGEQTQGGDSDEPVAATPYRLELDCDKDSQAAPEMKPGKPGRIGVNANRHDRRTLLGKAMGKALEDDGDLWVSNCAGNPLIAPLLAGELSAIYEPKALQLHDAAFLVPLYLAGGEIWSPHGSQVDVLRHFERLDSRREIGPFVAGTTKRAVDRVLDALKRQSEA